MFHMYPSDYTCSKKEPVTVHAHVHVWGTHLFLFFCSAKKKELEKVSSSVKRDSADLSRVAAQHEEQMLVHCISDCLYSVCLCSWYHVALNCHGSKFSWNYWKIHEFIYDEIILWSSIFLASTITLQFYVISSWIKQLLFLQNFGGIQYLFQ